MTNEKDGIRDEGFPERECMMCGVSIEYVHGMCGACWDKIQAMNDAERITNLRPHVHQILDMVGDRREKNLRHELASVVQERMRDESTVVR